MPWSKLSLRYEASEGRGKQFAAGFAEQDFRVSWKDYRIGGGKIDNLTCPQIALPESYESWLQSGVSSNTRQKIRRFTQRLIDSGEMHITETTPENFDAHLDILAGFWRQKWATAKGDETAERVADNYRKILIAAQDLGIVHMPVLWRGDQPLGVLGHVLDLQQRRVHFIVVGRDEAAGDAAVGLLLHAFSIRWAIKCGYRVYDFCHGNERYKYSYEAEDRRVNYLLIRRRSSGEGDPMLDHLSTGEALFRAIGFIEQGKPAEAAAACRQILYDCI